MPSVICEDKYRETSLPPSAPDALRLADKVAITGEIDSGFECYFTRGIVLSQFMAKFLKGDESDTALAQFKKTLNDDPDGEHKIRTFLGAALRKRLIELVATTNQQNGHVFVALYELSDNLLIEKLKAYEHLVDGLLARPRSANSAPATGSITRATPLRMGCTTTTARISGPIGLRES